MYSGDSEDVLVKLTYDDYSQVSNTGQGWRRGRERNAPAGVSASLPAERASCVVQWPSVEPSGPHPRAYVVPWPPLGCFACPLSDNLSPIVLYTNQPSARRSYPAPWIPSVTTPSRSLHPRIKSRRRLIKEPSRWASTKVSACAVRGVRARGLWRTRQDSARFGVQTCWTSTACHMHWSALPLSYDSPSRRTPPRMLPFAIRQTWASPFHFRSTAARATPT